ncbi:MFS transporter [Dictyobacter arantiisoli]|uniref:Permease n=1 Tax=Dictyobacter arantiisoli TaxID=2014874 RepID=A0A5A5T978_9CHLR|nr:MFS transporter [Dictyobacter arantiisoli]GCF07825.1 permease [Dictyobacter arantiisoli]
MSKVEVSPSIANDTRGEAVTFDRRLVWLMAVACALAVANLYYIQPMLASMARDFSVSVGQVGVVATMGQVGYACGLLLIIPLGDNYNQRKLIVGMLVAVIIALVAMALAPSILLVTVASFLVGLATVVPQLIIPYAASLAPEKARGQVVGTVMSGLLIGILLARTLSGFIAAQWGWREMYWIAAVMMIVLAVVVRFFLPNDLSAKGSMSYPQLLHSLWDLLREESILREVIIFGSMAFGAFSAFWVTLSFYLETPPYHFGSEVAGLFGLVGVVGALAASLVGKIADRRDPRFANGVSLVITLISFVLMWLAGQWLVGLIIGTILLDLGTQANQVTSQARIYSIRPEARNRMNTVYMFCYFVGGSLGSMLGTFGWGVAKWNGVSLVACAFLVVALVAYAWRTLKLRQYMHA